MPINEKYYIDFKKEIKKLDTNKIELKLDSAYKTHMFNIGLLNGLIIEQERLSREMYILNRELKERSNQSKFIIGPMKLYVNSPERKKENVISNKEKKRTDR